MRKIKQSEEKLTMYTFITTDGRKFTSQYKKEAFQKAKAHQSMIDMEDAREKISKDLWDAFGLDPDNYNVERYIYDADENDPDFDDCQILEELFTEFGHIINGEGAPATFDEFMDTIQPIFMHHYDKCKIIMDVISKHLSTEG